jgi:hypothetical protein
LAGRRRKEEGGRRKEEGRRGFAPFPKFFFLVLESFL